MHAAHRRRALWSPGGIPSIDPRDAVTIVIGESAATYEDDLRVPGKLALIEIQVRILKSDGKPPLPEDHPQVRFEEPGLQGPMEDGAVDVDADGWFQIELCEGVAYSAFAFAGSPKNAVYSAPLEFTANRKNQHLEFILDKSPDELLNSSGALQSQKSE